MKILYSLIVVLFLTLSGFSQPSILSFSPTTGAIGSLITITGTNLNNPTTFNIGGVPAIVVSNNGSTLVGMLMPGATTGNISISNTGGSVNSSNSFNITQTLYPSVQQGNKLIGIGTIGHANLGSSVSLSADGNTAIVGGMNDSSSIGAAWIYTRNGSTWSQQGTKLKGTGNIGNICSQGISVALSADGNTAIVGGSDDDGQKGAAWVFVRNGNTWIQQGNKLVGTGVLGNSYQGCSVALSADGNTAVVAGMHDNLQGAVWVFNRIGGVWMQQGNKLIASGNTEAFGWSVAISADGNTIIVGAAFENNEIGAAYIYTRSGNNWTQQGNKLIGTGSIGNARQGISVALSADGNTAIIGGHKDNNSVGAVWIFIRSNSNWTQQGTKLVGTGICSFFGAALSDQGNSVALSADGNTAIVGGPADSSGAGAIWVFTRSGNIWTQKGSKMVGNSAVGGSAQGMSIGISADGNTAVFGGSNDNNNEGAAWIFVSSPQIPTSVAALFNYNSDFSIYPNPSNGLFIINLNKQDVSYTITSIAGRLIEHKNNVDGKSISIDLKNESSGMYFVKIEGINYSEIIKLIKQ